jgi:LysM repeat protein
VNPGNLMLHPDGKLLATLGDRIVVALTSRDDWRSASIETVAEIDSSTDPQLSLHGVDLYWLNAARQGDPNSHEILRIEYAGVHVTAGLSLWSTRQTLIVNNPSSAWLRTAPDSGSDQVVTVLPYNSPVVVAGQPHYDGVQWWWPLQTPDGLVSGWVEQNSLAESASSPPPPPTGACVPRSDWTVRYLVQPNDTLYGIALRAGVSLDELKQGNCLTSDTIHVNQPLSVPRNVGSVVQPVGDSSVPVPDDTIFSMEVNPPPTNTPTTRPFAIQPWATPTPRPNAFPFPLPTFGRFEMEMVFPPAIATPTDPPFALTPTASS